MDIREKNFQLSFEQRSQLRSNLDKFIKIGFDTKSLNKPNVIEAINSYYKYINVFNNIEIIFVKSPIVGASIAKNISNSSVFLEPYFGSMEVDYLSEISAYKDLFSINNFDPIINCCSPLIKECGWIWFFENLCIVSEKPNSIVLNQEGQLHNLKGPAISWSDGYSQYWIDGKFIQPAIGERLVWYLNHRKSNNQPKFSLKKELKQFSKFNFKLKQLNKWLLYPQSEELSLFRNKTNRIIYRDYYKIITFKIYTDVLLKVKLKLYSQLNIKF